MDVLVRVTDAEELRGHPETRLFEQRFLDSLGTVELLLQLSAEFGIRLSPTEVDRDAWATPARIVAFIQHRLDDRT